MHPTLNSPGLWPRACQSMYYCLLVIFNWYFLREVRRPWRQLGEDFRRVASASHWVGVSRAPCDRFFSDFRRPCCPSFSNRFFDAVFDRFLVDFPSQLGTKNRPKSLQKSMPRCIPSWGPFFDRFLIDCCSQLPHPNPENRAPAAAGARFLKNRLSKLPLIFDPIFDPILVPTWLCFVTKNHQNCFNDRSQDVSKK